MEIKKVELMAVVKKIRKDKDVIAIMLFGSYARNKKYARDVDLCVFLDKNYGSKEVFKKRLNYLAGLPGKFGVPIFQQLPLYVRISVLREGKMLFCRNENLVYEFAFLTIKEFNDFKEIYENYIENALK